MSMSSRVALEGKTRLPGKVADCVNDAASACTQIVKGSKSAEVLNTSIKNFVLQEAAIENSASNTRRLSLIVSHLKATSESVEKR